MNDLKQLISVFEDIHYHLRHTTVSVANQALTVRNWLFGYYIKEYEQNGSDRASYGEKLLQVLSEGLKERGVKDITDRYLRYCRQFFNTYPQLGVVITEKSLPNQIWKTVSSKFVQGENPSGISVKPELLARHLTYSHFIELSKEPDPMKRAFYEVESIKGGWSVRETQRQMGSLLYERTGLSGDKERLLAMVNDQALKLTPGEIIRDPYVFEFLGLRQGAVITEDTLEQALLDHLQEFLLELGKGFCFEARQKRITVDNEHYYLDLLFYHRLLKCHVLVDLKMGKFTHKDAGQLNFYINYIRDNEQKEGDNPPIGILLCTQKDETMVRYALGGMDNQLFVSKYKLALPSEEELRALIEKDKKLLK